ncbi:MAG: hypothetical protein EOM72_14410, partial [Opitutae bacterium]|nr:hypothetical protein [Opitutae bacterium]
MILTISRKSRPPSPGLFPQPRPAGLLLAALALPLGLAAEPQLVTNDPLARETFFDRKEEGWFWYRDAAEEELLPLPP